MYANQSVSLAEVMDALNNLLVAATGFQQRRVIEWHYSAGRPDLTTGDSNVWFRVNGGPIDSESGAGRHGMKNDLEVEINLNTRGFKDGSQRDKSLARAHWVIWYRILNSIAGQFLFPEYLPYENGVLATPTRTTGFSQTEADERRIRSEGVAPTSLTSTGTMIAKVLPQPDHTARPEQGYIETRMQVTIPVVLELTLDSVPLIED